MPTVPEGPLAAICTALGYEFTDYTLLRAALTHRSYSSEHAAPVPAFPGLGNDNERLEFLGDSVIGMAVADTLWRRDPGAREGELSRMRAAVVNEVALAATALRIGIEKGLRLGRGEDRSGGRARASMLADAFEAVIAAVYLDGGFDAARGAAVTALGPRIDEVLAGATRDAKSALQERLQADYKVTPRYELVASHGPDHDREHEVELHAGDIVHAKGRGRSKKDAEQMAARFAMAELDARVAPRSDERARESVPPGEGST